MDVQPKVQNLYSIQIICQMNKVKTTLPAIMVERVSCIYWDYPSISMFSPDLSSTVKWSSQTMIRSSQRFTRASSKAFSCAGCCLMKSCSSLMRAICASLVAVSTVHFFRCSRSWKISSAISSQASLLLAFLRSSLWSSCILSLISSVVFC